MLKYFTWHSVVQLVNGLANASMWASHYVPDKYKPLVSAVSVILTFVLHSKAFASLPPQ